MVMPEHHAGCLLLRMEEVELLAEAAVIALFRLFEAVHIGLQLLLVTPRSAIDTLQHRLAGIPAPVGAGELHQLEALTQRTRARQVRPATDVEPVTLAIDGDFLTLRDDVVDDLDLVMLAEPAEDRLGLLAVQHFALDGQVALDDLAHARLDLFEVNRCKSLAACKVVIKAVLDGRPDGDLGPRKKLLHRLGHDVGGVVAQKLQRLVAFARHDGYLGIAIHDAAGIHHLTIHAARERGLCQAGTDIGSNVRNGNRAGEIATGTVRKGDLRHDTPRLSASGDPYERPLETQNRAEARSRRKYW